MLHFMTSDILVYFVFLREKIHSQQRVHFHLLIINPLHVEIFRTLNLYLQFLPFLHADKTQVVGITSHGIQEATHLCDQYRGC